MAEKGSMIGCTRVSKADSSQVNHLQHDALIAASDDPKRVYRDSISGARDSRPGLDACRAVLASGDTLVIWKLDRLGRRLCRLVINTVGELTARGIGLKVLTGEGTTIDTTSASGRLMFGIFAALAECERELIAERTKAGIAAAKARGEHCGRPCELTPKKIRLLQWAMRERQKIVAEFGISKATAYRYVSPSGELRASAMRVLELQGVGQGKSSKTA
jgi:DNA invertase Pin-like site-specific DNA recombinase